MRAWALGALLLLVLPTLPPSAAQAVVGLDVADLEGDVTLDDRGTGERRMTERPAMDVVRLAQRIEEGDVVLALRFAAPPDLPRVKVEMLNQLSSGIGPAVMLDFASDDEGAWPETATGGFVTESSQGRLNATISVEGETMTVRYPLPEGAACHAPWISLSTSRLGEPEYSESVIPDVSGCDPEEILDGATGACPPAPEGLPELAASFDDADGDVRTRATYAEPARDAPGRPDHDILSVESALEGDEVVQRVRLAAPPAQGEVKVEILNRLSGGQERDAEPEDALVVRYWRFENASQTDRVEARLVAPDGTERPAYVETTREDATLTFRWCASLLPDDATCFDVEAEATSGLTGFPGGFQDEAAPARNACLLAAAPAEPTAQTPDEEEPTDEPAEEDVAQEEPAQTPGAPVAAALVALGLVALAARRR